MWKNFIDLLRFVAIFCFCFVSNWALSQTIILGKVRTDRKPIERALIIVDHGFIITETNQRGVFRLDSLSKGAHTLQIYADGYHVIDTLITFPNATSLIFNMEVLNVDIGEVNVNDDSLYLHPAIDGVTLLHAKTISYTNLEKITANFATNNAREIFKKTPGLNAWENDHSGLQLNIGSRGLSPNRTSHFNTKQNGYDISADALGYPESYYTPPMQAVERIELIRGAASLQFGTQFGGLLNFVLKKGNKKNRFHFLSENTYGSNHFVNTFTSLGGTSANGKWNYYSFFQYKRGDGWRPNSAFNTVNAYAQLSYAMSDHFSIKVEQTFMYYLTQQAGGMTDANFWIDPSLSTRERNWFRVNWNLSSISFEYKPSTKTTLKVNNFLLHGFRKSLGNLQPIHRTDYGGARNLIVGNYLNFGSEARLVHRYDLWKRTSSLVIGTRFYKGMTTQQQGLANDGNDGSLSDFQFLNNSDGIQQSDYSFPSTNIALFAEHYFSITDRFAVSPGFRLEYIHTKADGYYQDLLVIPSSAGQDTLRNQAIDEIRTSDRLVFLMGLGTSYKINDDFELYANISQNYRAINFNDMRIVNPNQEVDPNLKDESGFNADFGVRGSFGRFLSGSATLFYMHYADRIGNVELVRQQADNPMINELYTLRTNIGDARVFGLELLLEMDVISFIKPQSSFTFKPFLNVSILDGRYTASAQSFAAGNQLEYVAPFILRTVFDMGYKDWGLSYQYSYTHQHFSDATNAMETANAVVGVIPSYGIMDISTYYTYKYVRVQVGVNNLTNERYFTRRAASYPGPGILPGNPINFYVTARFEIGVK